MNYENPSNDKQKYSRRIVRVPDSVWGQDNAARGISVHDGFPNPATDTSLQLLDLNQLLIKHRISTYFMRLAGDDWQSIGIFGGDILIVDRALKPRANDLVVWWEGENFKLSYKHEVPLDTPTFGVVAHAIHSFRKESL